MSVLKNWNKAEAKISMILPRMNLLNVEEILDRLEFVHFSSNNKNEYKLKSFSRIYIPRIIHSFFFRPLNNTPNLIISSSHMIYDILPAIWLSIRFKVKLVLYVHHILRHGSYEKGKVSNMTLFSESISTRLSKRADLIFVYNQEIKNSLVSMGFHPHKIYLTKNAVEHDYINSIKPENENFEASFCGMITKLKGVYDLVEIWQEIIKSHSNARLLIIGEGPELENLVSLIRSRSLQKNILLAGFLSEDQKISKIKSSKLFIFPSYLEGWGIVVSEAMACEVPVVSYDLSAYDTFAAGIIKVPLGDKKRMISSILKLLSDENSRLALAKEAKAASKKLNWEDISAEEFSKISKLVLS